MLWMVPQPLHCLRGDLSHLATELMELRASYGPVLVVCASFVPEEITETSGPRLLHALREVASVADSLEKQITGADEE